MNWSSTSVIRAIEEKLASSAPDDLLLDLVKSRMMLWEISPSDDPEVEILLSDIEKQISILGKKVRRQFIYTGLIGAAPWDQVERVLDLVSPGWRADVPAIRETLNHAPGARGLLSVPVMGMA